jgi:AbiV family abortive infection protein
MNGVGAKIDGKTVAAMQACVVHARALLESALAVEAANHPNIAYHLATLSLEELGRRELIGVQSITTKRPEVPAWPEKHTQDHIKKLFWSFFGMAFAYERLTGKTFEELTSLARVIHANRLAGLYVDQQEDGLGVPAEAITPEECRKLIELASARLEIAESLKPREEIPPEELELQTWFLNTTEDREKRRMVFSGGSMAKLAELKDAKAWGQWLKAEFDQADSESRAAIEEELRRSRDLPSVATKDKWKIRIRIISASHTIRAKELAKWNRTIHWIKLSYAKKNELLVEFILKDNVPVEALWYFGWGIARRFVVGLNLGTMGFWWWRLPEHISRYYESVEDLEKHARLELDRRPSLKVDWGSHRVLTEQELDRVTACVVALPGPQDEGKHPAYGHYIGGLTFLSLNDIHWQCENSAFGNFFECLKEMMLEYGDLLADQSLKEPFLAFLDDMFPAMDERNRYADLFERFETKNLEGVVVTLQEATFMKLFCDGYFLRQVHRKGGAVNVDSSSEDVSDTRSTEPSAPQ